MKLLLFLLLNCVDGFGQWVYYNYSGALHSSEVDCYLTSLITYDMPGSVTEVNLTAEHVSNTCGIVDLNRWTWQAPQTQPYSTAGMQWTSLSFQYGTVEVRAALPSSASALWPAIWLLGANCQKQVAFVSHSGNGCPATATDPQYEEADLLECGGPVPWCQFTVFGQGRNNTCSNQVTDTNYHTWDLVWTSSSLALSKDGTAVCTISNPVLNVGPMYLIMQIQVTAPSNANLPATMKVDYVRVKDQNNNVIFFDDFIHAPVTIGH